MTPLTIRQRLSTTKRLSGNFRFAALTGLGLLVVALVILSIWLPIWRHYHVSTPGLEDNTVSRSRSRPSDEILREIGSLKHRLVPPIGRDPEDPVALAGQLLPDKQRSAEAQLFDPERLTDLDYASLDVPRLLLRAYDKTGDPAFLEQARRFLLDFAHYEQSAWLPHGFLWNDHAVAVRPVTLAEFWHHYRNAESYKTSIGRMVLENALTIAHRLADPKHYTYSSNHGTLQNLGLLHLGLAFPELPGVAGFTDLAVSRQREQMSYLFTREGIWRENSAGYHRLALELTGIFLRYMTLLEMEIPSDMRQTYEAAMSYYVQLRAPDGSLPRMGDTSHSSDHEEPLTTTFDASGGALPMMRGAPSGSPRPERLYADAGQSIWWSGEDLKQQTAVTWLKFDHHGHKHADELSLNLRTRHGRWWTSVGYWPLEHVLRRKAQSWPGSNAPHLLNEPEDSARYSQLMGYGWTPGAAAIDLERRGPGAFVVRRQVVHVEPSLWLTIDAFGDDSARVARIIWGVDRDIDVQPGPFGNAYELVKTDGEEGMLAHFLAHDSGPTRLMRGSTEPFAGWVEVDMRAIAANAIVVETSTSDTWTAVVSMLHRRGQAERVGPARMVAWSGAEHWRMEVPTAAAVIGVVRRADMISIEQDSVTLLQLPIAYDASRTGIDSDGERRYLAAAEKYGGRFADLIEYRWKMMLALLVILIVQETAIFLLQRVRPALSGAARIAGIGLWLSLGGWLHLAYFP